MARHNILSPMTSPNYLPLSTDANLIQTLQNEESFILTTHKNSDGDGVGSAVALYWGLKQENKSVQFYHVDPIPIPYLFLLENTQAHLFNVEKMKSLEADVLLITDTNQGSLCDPLYTHFKNLNKKIIFVDHHIPSSTPDPREKYYIRTDASSTGEVVYDILKELKTKITPEIATALYTSITFDTQAFKLLRNSSRSHEIAALLAKDNIQTDKIQRELFATWTVQKMNFLAILIQSARYSKSNTIAGFTITQEQLKKYELQLDHINDILDMFTLIKTVEFCYNIIEMPEGRFKLSFRSINSNKAFVVAESFGGGGHAKSAGAWVSHTTADKIEAKILNFL
ncbi:MAG: DHH family phosphoesterase [Bdellovibrionaceae bacterium]|nr:DHH family phosphoesterase [Pseudobdellovibrionaceae bacterium]